jgi:hypothetical protein
MARMPPRVSSMFEAGSKLGGIDRGGNPGKT